MGYRGQSASHLFPDLDGGLTLLAAFRFQPVFAVFNDAVYTLALITSLKLPKNLGCNNLCSVDGVRF